MLAVQTKHLSACDAQAGASGRAARALRMISSSFMGSGARRDSSKGLKTCCWFCCAAITVGSDGLRGGFLVRLFVNPWVRWDSCGDPGWSRSFCRL